MRRVTSNQLEDFAAIYDEDVEIVSVSRPQAGLCETLSQALIRSRRVPQSRWSQTVGDSQAAAGELPPGVDGALVDQIAQASEVLGELLGCERVGVRLETLSAPMCPRFHIDQIPCRMLITLSGSGTEWIPNDDVDWTLFADLDSTQAPLRVEGQIRSLTMGHWSLLKGGKWDEQFRGVVHRSPHDAGERLLLSLDPIFNGSEYS